MFGTRARGWLHSPWLDLCGLALCWVPLYWWLIFGLGLGGDLPTGHALRLLSQDIALAVLVVLAVTYVHRHYTLLLVYGDAEIFARRAAAFIYTPLVVLGLVGGAFVFLPDFWLVIIVIATLWNVWHTIMQRYGILRIYARLAQGGLETPRHGRRDLALLWSCIVFVACLVMIYRQPTFMGFPGTDTLAVVVGWIESTPLSWGLPLVAAMAMLVAWWQWLYHEMRAPLTWRARVPRWSFLSSTLLLMAIFVVHGPIVGYITFGVAHAIEYIVFVHLYGAGKYVRPRAPRGFAAWLFGPSLPKTVLVIGAFIAIYIWVQDYRATRVYIVYYTATSFLHFLYDGWIWKTRKRAEPHPLAESVLTSDSQ